MVSIQKIINFFQFFSLVVSLYNRVSHDFLDERAYFSNVG